MRRFAQATPFMLEPTSSCFMSGAYFRSIGGGRRAAVPRRGRLSGSRLPNRTALSRAASGDALELFDLSRQLTDRRTYLPPRSRRLRPQSAPSALARRRAHRRAVRGQLRGGRREQHPARRRGLGGFPVRDGRRRALARPAAYEHGIDLRIRLPRRLLAALADVHRTEMPVTVFGVATPSSAIRRPSPPCRRPIGRSPATASNGSTTRISARGGARAPRRGDPHPHARSPASGRSGWYTGRTSDQHQSTWWRKRAAFSIRRDSYADELPYWVSGPNGPQLVVPYTLDANDMRFATPQGFNARRPVLLLPEGQFRYALRGRRDGAEDDVGGPALQAGRASGACGGAGALPRLRSVARTGLGGAAHRHRPALAIASSARRVSAQAP